MANAHVTCLCNLRNISVRMFFCSFVYSVCVISCSVGFCFSFAFSYSSIMHWELFLSTGRRAARGGDNRARRGTCSNSKFQRSQRSGSGSWRRCRSAAIPVFLLRNPGFVESSQLPSGLGIICFCKVGLRNRVVFPLVGLSLPPPPRASDATSTLPTRLPLWIPRKPSKLILATLGIKTIF